MTTKNNYPYAAVSNADGTSTMVYMPTLQTLYKTKLPNCIAYVVTSRLNELRAQVTSEAAIAAQNHMKNLIAMAAKDCLMQDKIDMEVYMKVLKEVMPNG